MLLKAHLSVCLLGVWPEVQLVLALLVPLLWEAGLAWASQGLLQLPQGRSLRLLAHLYFLAFFSSA